MFNKSLIILGPNLSNFENFWSQSGKLGYNKKHKLKLNNIILTIAQLRGTSVQFRVSRRSNNMESTIHQRVHFSAMYQSYLDLLQCQKSENCG